MFITRALLTSCLAVLILGSAPASADPIALTGGGVSIGKGRPNIWVTLVFGDTVISATRNVRPDEVINPQCPCPPGRPSTPAMLSLARSAAASAFAA